MSENTTPAKKTPNAEVLRIAAIYKGDLKLEEQNGQKTGVAADDTFVKTLPEGQTIDMYEKVFTHLDNNAAGFAHAFGEWATEQVAAGNFNDKDGRKTLDASVTLVGKNNITGSYTDVKVSTTKSLKDPNETITTTKYGDMRISYEMNGDKNRGQLKVVKNHINDLASEAFAKLNK